MGESSVFMIVIANWVLGLAVLTCLIVVLYGITSELVFRVRRRAHLISEMDSDWLRLEDLSPHLMLSKRSNGLI